MKKFKFLLGVVILLMLIALMPAARRDGPPSALAQGVGKIAFASDRDGNWEIYVMNADGSDQINLTDNPADDYSPAWSPDGSKIVFFSYRDGNEEIYVMNADGSDQINLTDHPAGDYSPAWSPDGSKIAFVSNRDGNGEIYVMNADGSDQINLTDNPADDYIPAWSPDGKHIAFVSTRDGDEEIYVMNADGSDQTNLTGDPAYDFYPAWSPDGKHITFVSTRDGDEEIYVMNADGTDLTRLTDNPASDTQPAWSPPLGKPGLVITHRACLENQVGAVDWDELERLVEGRYGTLVYLDGLGSAPEPAEIDRFIEDELSTDNYAFVLILGGHEVVPFGVLPNPTTDGDTLYTDDTYADTDHDDLLVPDLPLARMPDGGEFSLLMTQLSEAGLPAKTGFSVAQPLRPFARYIAALFGKGDDVIWSAPSTYRDIGSGEANANYDYFMLHGSDGDTGVWWGEDPEDGYPMAFIVDQAHSEGVILTGACYGAYILDRTAEDSIALQFLDSGARAFVGATGIHYSGRQETPERYGPVFHQLFVEKVVEGEPPLQAYFAAKLEFADQVQDPVDLKILHEFIYLGAP